MKNFRKIYLLIGLFIVIIIIESAIIIYQSFIINDNVEANNDINSELVDLRYQDSFESINVYDYEGNSTTLEYGENNILFYLSSACSSCSDVLNFYSKLKIIFGSDNLNIILLWSDTIPNSLVKDYNIPLENCYSTKGLVSINTPTPTAYVLSNKGEVLYFNNDIKASIEKLYNQTIEIYNNEEEMRLTANTYLKDLYNITENDKNQIIYFYMKGCPDCENADNILSADKTIRNINYLYKYDDTDITHTKDDYALFRLVYGINWYPSFLIFQPDGNFRIVGEVNSEDLIDAIDGLQ